MDAFSMFKFWKTTKTKVAVDGDCDADTVTDSTFSDPTTAFSDDDDDSYFELELTLPKFNTNSSSSPLTQIDLNSDKIEPKINSKPQSPISILRSASPKFRIFMFGKFNKKSKNADEFNDNDSVSSNFSPKSNNSTPFTVKFKIEDGSIVPKFTRTNSSNQLLSPNIERRSSDDSKRFSKDVVQKYLNFVKPLYSKKRNEGGERFTVSCSPTRSSSASFSLPVKESRFKAKTKQFGKSKSASAMIVSPSTAKNDHPCDGIEGAILHCKKSLNSSTRGQSSLSRCSSDPSHEKSITMSEESKERNDSSEN
ncbi:hypothetical protein RND81_05G093100 [Saponaria officinalis]|uniref:Membrane-associated kinase regulator 5 n=1 Tax=Saponaria officinalis TaxID=3572 RepID=A0AAW1KZC9_SAPOF